MSQNNNQCITQYTAQENELYEIEQEILREQALQELKAMLLELLQTDREVARKVIGIVLRSPYVAREY